MRADRLLSILMILQTRGRQTATRLAAELEVSERTIYRDVLALSSAGVPVYCERGPGGGIALIEDYRTNLTGLTDGEARALFMLSIPSPLVDLGVNDDLQSALRKLAASLPPARLPEARLSLERVYLDWTTWEGLPGSTPHLALIQQAVWKGKSLALTYRSPMFGDWIEPLQAVVEPYGLVAKAGQWYLVCLVNGHLQVIPVSGMLRVEHTNENFYRSAGFILAEFWEDWCTRQKNSRPHYNVHLRAAMNAIPLLRRRFSNLDDLRKMPSGTLADGQEYIVGFESFEEARGFLLGCGQAVEVLSPEALRLSVADYAKQIVELYSML